MDKGDTTQSGVEAPAQLSGIAFDQLQLVGNSFSKFGADVGERQRIACWIRSLLHELQGLLQIVQIASCLLDLSTFSNLGKKLIDL